MNPSTQIFVVDDHPLVARGLAHFIHSSCQGLTVVPMTRWEEAMNLLATSGAPALLIADVWLGDNSSLSVLDTWKAICPSTPWLAISGDDNPHLRERVRAAGAQGFVHKQDPPETFASAVAAVLRGDTWFAGGTSLPTAIDSLTITHGLTLRQGEILAGLLRGLPNKRIASELGITEATVKEHVTAILSRLGVRTRIEAITTLSGHRHAAHDHAGPRRG